MSTDFAGQASPQPTNRWQMAVRMTLIESATQFPKRQRSQSFVEKDEKEELKYGADEDPEDMR